MSKLTIIWAFMIILLCSTLTFTMLAQAKTAVVGVSEGNVFEYDMVAYWTSTYTDTVPAEVSAYNQTEWIRVTITGVSGTRISMRVTTHYRNGTEIGAEGFSDVETGEGSEGPPFIGANLGRNDLVNPSAAEKWYINETVTRTYKEGTRETNHLKLQYVETDSTVGEFTRMYDYYFDKRTGALVEYTSQVSYSGFSNIIKSKLTSSNVWVIPEFPAFIILPLFAALTLFALAAKKRLFRQLL
ncbi:MAG: hypothetical protein NWE94_04405 [Candidatus Bathyarchaeota archaeon]|nr:hypothetical protein [Candidatus Bathyarchaeota archaeon]